MTQGLSRGRFLALAGLVFLFAFMLREQYVLQSVVEAPIRGDVRQYVAYAYNLSTSGTFSSAEPGSPVVPDAFRGPGYPALVALVMRASATEGAWLRNCLQLQVVLGALTALLAVVLGRRWLSRELSLCAGLLVAAWPHHIAATGVLLSEVWLGFLLLGALCLASRSLRHREPAAAVGAGLVLGLAYLVNPVVLLFSPLAALACWKVERRTAIALLALPLLVAAGWGVRNQALPHDDRPGRGAINFVQGSWPMMHAAYALRFQDASAEAMMQAMGDEERLFAANPRQGLVAMGQRMAEAPSAYVRWYVLEKPWLLWDWDIRIGAGDVYVLEVERSPLESNPVLHAIKQGLHRANFVIFLLSAAAAFSAVAVLARNPRRNPELLLVSVLAIYLTLAHVVFQAEPRYAVAYRPLEMLLLVTALGAIPRIAAWLRRRSGRVATDPAGSPAEPAIRQQ